jgi:23S rRNA (guanine2445-N2)-methyltransferase / 23S rRNA (guanine2069-N7)-methyltransferase
MPSIYIATAAQGLEPLLVQELQILGANTIESTTGAVRFTGEPELAYRVCLWSRLASRLLLPLARFTVLDAQALYEGVHALPWEDHLAPDGTLAVDFVGSSQAITHSHFGALKVKDAIVDRLRARHGQRPSVARIRPQLRINVHLRHEQATVSVDLAGESLHRRAYRLDQGQAPLKENLAAAILWRANWPTIAASGGAFVDPMCGAGTLAIEAAMLAADIAPGLHRTYYGFQGWLGHVPRIWQRLLEEAAQRRLAGMTQLPSILGYDADSHAVHQAIDNAERAGLSGRIHFERRELHRATPPAAARSGLIATNPPYGERLGRIEELIPLYRSLGEHLKQHFSDWQAAVITSEIELGKAIGLRARKRYALYNGALKCTLLLFSLDAGNRLADAMPAATADTPPEAAAAVLGNGPQMLVNRLHKNLKQLSGWLQREQISCYRLYDADLPQYALAVDRYGPWVHVQEYAPPASIDPEQAQRRLQEALSAISMALAVPRSHIFLKQRRRQKGTAQYDKQADAGNFVEVNEGGLHFLVNLSDYLDTGLFLDHRITRARLRELAHGKRFLNLFGYTGTASVYAAAGGAVRTTTVDASQTYLAWARRNMARNGFALSRHDFVRADCLRWLQTAQTRYDLIFLDPPTFSNSKRSAQSFDVQRDHVALLQAAGRLLAPRGTLIFSTNYRRFKLNQAVLPGFAIEDLSTATLPPDFARNPRIHQCWQLRLT